MIMMTAVSSATLFSQPDKMSEQIDEILFGDSAEILEEQGEFVKIKTEYGYYGCTKKSNLSENLIEPNSRVCISFADLLPEERNFFKPIIAIPFGAKVKTEDIGHERYLKIHTPDGKELFIHKNHISPIKKPTYEAEIRDSVVDTAMQYLGTQYRWGGRTCGGIDCSGLCFNSYRFNGIDIWRDAHIEKSERLSKIELVDAKKADLIFFKGHIALYLGNGIIIHSTASKGRVVIERIAENDYLNKNYICTGTIFK